MNPHFGAYTLGGCSGSIDLHRARFFRFAVRVRCLFMKEKSNACDLR
jgi:hypothetical protein